MFIVTKDWIIRNQTSGKAYTKRQFDVLGIEWPPIKGWIKRSEGKSITENEKRLFESDSAIENWEPQPDKKKNKAKKKAAKKFYKSIPKDGHNRSDWRKQSEVFYKSEEWRALRYKALQICGGKCQCCGASKADGKVMHVDHVKPRYIYPKLALDLTNLQVLCDDCNIGKGAWDDTDWRTEEQRQQLQHMRNI